MTTVTDKITITEVLRLVLDELARPGWPLEPFLNIRLVSRRFHNIYLEHTFRTLILPLDIGLPRYSKALLERLGSPQWKTKRETVRIIELQTGPNACTDMLECNVAEMLPAFPQLNTIKIPHNYNGRLLTTLLQGIDRLHTPVSADIKLCGSLTSCSQILSDFSCFCALQLTPRHFQDPWESPLSRQGQVLDLGLIIRQTSLTRLSVTDDHRWCFIAPKSPPALPLALQELCLEGQESAIDPPNYRILLNYLDLQALKVLGIKGTWLVAAVLEDLRGEVPNLEVIRLDGGQYPLRYLSNDTTKNEYDSISRFFDRTRLCNISIHNITQDVLSLNFVSASGPALRQLAIHVTDDYWNFLPDRSIPPSGVRALSATQDHLEELNSMCPNIERLGLDVSGLTVAKARHGPLDSLLRFRRLRHLHLFFHPPEGTRGRPSKLTLLSGLDLVQLFLHLHDHNTAVKLETLLYRDTRSEEECMVWHTGQRRLLLSYRFDVLKRPDPAMEVREIYEGTRLVRTWKQPMEKGTIFDEETFPG